MDFFNDIEKYDDQICMITSNQAYISYKEFVGIADKITESIPQRSLVFLVCSNIVDCVAAYIGFLRKKIVPILINENLDIHLFLNLYETYQPHYIFCPLSWQVQGNQVLNTSMYKLLKTDVETNYIIHQDLALLLTTSGSTGSPKLVRLTYNNLISNASSIAEYLNIIPSDRAITTMPMNYSYGLSIINSHLLQGASIICTEYSLMQKEFWGLIKEQKATTFGGVPYIYEMLARLRFERMELPSLRYITQAGGKLASDLVEYFCSLSEQKGIQFIVMYGQTEATARMSYLPWELCKSYPSSIGVPIPNGHFHVVDTNGNLITDKDMSGELIYTGPNVSMGYAICLDDLGNGDENKGVLYTGDIARIGEHNLYYIVGRKKRFVKLFGNRVNLDELESILNASGFLCACGGADNLIKIYMTGCASIDDVINFAAKTTGLSRSGFEIIRIDEIPRNESGKILYSKLETN